MLPKEKKEESESEAAGTIAMSVALLAEHVGLNFAPTHLIWSEWALIADSLSATSQSVYLFFTQTQCPQWWKVSCQPQQVREENQVHKYQCYLFPTFMPNM